LIFFPKMWVSGERAVNFIKHAVLTDSFHTIWRAGCQRNCSPICSGAWSSCWIPDPFEA